MMDQADLDIGVFLAFIWGQVLKQSIDFASGQIKVIICVGLVLV